jgi:hypothetical protein
MTRYGMRRKIDFSILILFLFFCILNKQTLAQPFQKHYSDNAFYNIVHKSPGEFLVAGMESEAGKEVRLGKYNTKGIQLNTLGVVPHNGSQPVSIHTMRNIICLDGDSMVVPLYKTSSATDAYSLGGILKLDTALTTVGWSKRYQTGLVNTNSQSTLMALMRTKTTAHYVAAGWTNPGFAGAYQFVHGAYVFKTNLQGQIVWSRHLLEGYDHYVSVCEAANGDYVFGGNTVFSPRLMCMDPNGNIKWIQLYSIGGKGGQHTGMTPTSDGGYLITGTVLYNGFAMKLNSAGQVVWATELGGTGESKLSKGYETSDGEFLIAGTTNLQTHGGKDGWLVRIRSNGTLAWSKVYGTAAEEQLHDLVEEDGMVYAVGVANGQGWMIGADAETGELGCGEKTTSPVVYDRTATTVVTMANYQVYQPSVVYNGPATIHTPAGTSGDLCIPLPVTLVSFIGYARPEGNVLQWQTSYEQNNKYFAIERSEDGVHWNTVGMKEGTSYNTALKEYHFTDQEILFYKTTYYYRLQQTDEDGTSTWSSVIRIARQEKTEWEFLLSPQPAGELLRIEVLAEAPAYEVELWSMEGRLVLQTSFVQPAADIALNTLPGGIYVFKLLSQGEVKGIRKIIKN